LNPSADKLRVKTQCAGERVCGQRHQERCGYSFIKLSVSPPQRNVAVAHCVLQGKGQVRQRSISADLILVLLSRKEQINVASHVRKASKAIQKLSSQSIVSQ